MVQVTEQEYMLISDLARLRSAAAVMSETTPSLMPEEIRKSYVQVREGLEQLIQSLRKHVKVVEEDD